MSMLNRKLFRDLLANKTANTAVVIVISLGIMFFIAFNSTMINLDESQKLFYKECKIPDAYVDVISAPYSALNKIRHIEEVRNADARMIYDVRIDKNFGKDMGETKYLRLISMTDKIAEFQIIEGEYPQNGKNEVLIEKKFGEINKIKIGDIIPLVVGGTKKQLKVCGIMRSAEYVYSLRNVAQLFPDNTNFSIAFTDLESEQNILGKNYVNQFVYTVKNKNQLIKVQDNLNIILDDYSVTRNFTLSDQTSNMMLKQELKQLSGVSFVVPFLYLSVSTMILFIMLGRIIEKQRSQIGLLKAFGLSGKQIFIHYISYSMVIGFVGGVVGIVFGIGFSKLLSFFYSQFFNMPFIITQIPIYLYLLSIILSMAFAIGAGINAGRKAFNLEPGVAMRTKSPEIVKTSFVERSRHIMNMFTTSGKMSLRNIFRNKARSIFVSIGLMFTFALASLPWGLLYSIDELLFSHYDEVEKYDVRMYLSSPKEFSEIKNSLKNFEYVQKVEGLFEISSTLYKSNLKENIGIIALEKESSLYSLKKEGLPIDISPNSVVLTSTLAKKLNAKKGDIVYIESPMFKSDEKIQFFVSEVIEQTVGMSAYADREYISKLSGHKNLTTSLLIKGYPDTAKLLKQHFEDSSYIEGINDINNILAQMRMFTENFKTVVKILQILSVIMAFAVIFNSYAIILSEREKEFATLFVLGMSEKEVAMIIRLEQWILFFISIPFGIPISKIYFKLVLSSSNNDMFSLNYEAPIISFLIGGIISFFCINIAQHIYGKKIKEIKISEALKFDE